MPVYDVSELKFIKKGKVKNVYEVGDDLFLFEFTNKISVFDKEIPSLIPRKGETLNRCSSHWFKIAEKMGMNTHFIEMPALNQMLVQRAGSFPMKGPHEPDYDWVNETRTNYQIPLEVIARYYLAGSMFDRLRAGKVKPEDLGFPAGTDPKSIKKGTKLPEPRVEVTTKFEGFDRPVPVDEAYRIGGMMPPEYKEMCENVLSMDECIAREVESRGLLHVDGKKEFAFGPHRELMLIDTFGTSDEDRFWDKKAYEESEGQPEYNMIELSKEYARKYYRNIGYLEALEAARAAKQPEPDISALPDAEIAEMSRICLKLMEMITGEEA